MTPSARQASGTPFALMAVEGALVLGAVAAAVEWQFPGAAIERVLEPGLAARAIGFAIITVGSLYCWDFYDRYLPVSPRKLLLRLVKASASAAGILAIVSYLLPPLRIGRGILFVSIGLIVLIVFARRLAAVAVRSKADLRQRVLILGTGAVARCVAEEALARPQLGFKIHGFLDDDPALQGVSIVNPRVVGTTADVLRLVRQEGISRVVVALSERRGRLPLACLIAVKLAGTTVQDASSFYELLTGKILVEHLKPSSLIFSDGFRPSRAARAIKRLVELPVALVALLLTLPILLVLGLLVRFDSPGPALLRQVRVGERERHFVLYKFRSMRLDAESGSGPVWAAGEDPRVTRVGRWLRKLRLDELPQLWNVVRGDMSFVGPRPERPHFVDELRKEIPYYSERHAVKPGITGWAQVRHPYGNTVADALEKLKFDLYYIKNMSLGLDLAVLLRTVKVVLLGRGAL